MTKKKWLLVSAFLVGTSIVVVHEEAPLKQKIKHLAEWLEHPEI